MSHGFHDFVMKPAKQDEIYACLKKQLDIDYIYEVEVEPDETEKANEVLDLADIEIPEDIHSDLVEAVEMGNFTRIDEILKGIALEKGENHPLLKILRPSVKNYHLEGILGILEMMGNGSQCQSANENNSIVNDASETFSAIHAKSDEPLSGAE